MKNLNDPANENKDLKRRGYVVENRNVDLEERSLVGYASTKSVNSYNEVALPDSWELERFNKNPIMAWNHDYDVPPVGRVAWTKTDNIGLLFKGMFANTDFAQEILQLFADGALNAFSVGFRIIDYITAKNNKDEYSKLLDKWQIDGYPDWILTKNELWEISPVLMPANADAIVTSLKAHKIQNVETVKMIWRAAPSSDILGGDLVDACEAELERLNHEPGKVTPAGIEINGVEEETDQPDAGELAIRLNDLLIENDALKSRVAELETSMNYIDNCMLSIAKSVNLLRKRNAPEISAKPDLVKMIGSAVSGEIRKRQGRID